VFLLGDAAHIMPPFGGQGLNTGARDVANLAWKIIAVLRGEADAKILDSYDAERRSIIAEIVSFAGRVGRVTNMRSRPKALLRDAAFAIGNLFPAVRRYFDEGRYVPRPFYQSGLFLHHGDSEHSMTGRIFPRPMLRASDGKVVAFDALAGDGFAVVGVNVETAALADIARDPLWARLRAPVIAIRFGGPAAPGAGGVMATVLAEPDRPSPVKGQSGRVLIVRPDRYVAVTATPEEFKALSAQFARMLGDESKS
jgi:3-(3-hydroxy-phenyl)propionate hydroxylase